MTIHPGGQAMPQSYQVEDPLLSPKEAAAERRQAISTFYRDWRTLKLVPEPIYIGPRQPRWRRSVIRAGIEALAKTGTSTN